MQISSIVSLLRVFKAKSNICESEWSVTPCNTLAEMACLGQFIPVEAVHPSLIFVSHLRGVSHLELSLSKMDYWEQFIPMQALQSSLIFVGHLSGV